MLDVTSKIGMYISENKIDVDRIVKDTNIPESKLKGDTKEKLNATEFLCLCQYLNVKPEMFQ